LWFSHGLSSPKFGRVSSHLRNSFWAEDHSKGIFNSS
jgi:hypothetical protein